MNFELSPHQEKIATATKTFAAQEIAPFADRLEEDVDFRMGLYQKMGKQGLFNLAIQNDALAYALALKEVAKADAGISVAMTVTNMVAEAIKKYGTDAQKAHYLQSFQEGILVPAAFALTEKNIGSDAKNIEMQAHQNDGRYVLKGEKHLISNGDLAGVILVLAQVPDKGISAFLVDRQTNGLTVISKERKLGLLTAHLVRLRFDACTIPLSNRLGNEGEGLKIALNALNSGRIGIAAQSLGIAEAAFEAACTYASNRTQFGKPIQEFEGISFKLADMRTRLTAAELLLYKACWMQDQGKDLRQIAAEAKLFNSEMANDVTNQALQIHGGYGYLKSHLVEKYFRDARATTLYEGTSEIQRLLISRFCQIQQNL